MRTTFHRRHALATLALPATLAWPALTTAQTTINVIAFGGGVNWPIWIAQEKGLFAQQGLAVNLQFTPNSVESMTGLVSGKYDIAMAAIDNLVAYMEGQGEAPLPEAPDFFAFLGNQRGMLRVVAQPQIKSYAELKGQSIAVDALGTGFAFVLYKMLENAGLKLTDLKIERLGATPLRVQALLEGRTAASIINAPLDIPLMQRGFTRLGDATSELGSYQGTVAMAHRPRARDANILGYTRGWLQALRFLFDPANKEEALAIYIKNMKVERPAAESGYALLLGQTSQGREGLNRDGRVDIEGLQAVLRLRGQYASPAKVLTDTAKYLDESWLRRASS